MLLDRLQPRYRPAVLALKLGDLLKKPDEIEWDKVAAFVNQHERNEQRIGAEGPDSAALVAAVRGGDSSAQQSRGASSGGWTKRGGDTASRGGGQRRGGATSGPAGQARLLPLRRAGPRGSGLPEPAQGCALRSQRQGGRIFPRCWCRWAWRRASRRCDSCGVAQQRRGERRRLPAAARRARVRDAVGQGEPRRHGCARQCIWCQVLRGRREAQGGQPAECSSAGRAGMWQWGRAPADATPVREKGRAAAAASTPRAEPLKRAAVGAVGSCSAPPSTLAVSAATSAAAPPALTRQSPAVEKVAVATNCPGRPLDAQAEGSAAGRSTGR